LISLSPLLALAIISFSYEVFFDSFNENSSNNKDWNKDIKLIFLNFETKP
jgi:hypothetical protein